MLKPGQRAIVKIAARTISVRSGDATQYYNVLDYGHTALDNDFDNVILLRAALEDAKTPADVLSACKRYYSFPQHAHSAQLISA